MSLTRSLAVLTTLVLFSIGLGDLEPGPFAEGKPSTLTVTTLREAPVATSVVVTTQEGTLATGTLVATDVDSDALTFSLVTPPMKGLLTITDATTGAFTYSPYPATVGYDTFVFQASDGSSSSTAMGMVFIVAGSPRWPGQTVQVNLALGGGTPCRIVNPCVASSSLPFLRPSLSADGRYVAFDSDARNLVPGDTNGQFDAFVRDRQTGTTTRVSVSTSGAQGDNSSYEPQLSADGRYVAFSSTARNLVSGDTNGFTQDVFVRDQQTGGITLVSVSTAGGAGNGGSGSPSLSADGRYVVFESGASNLVPDDTNGTSDVFVHDRQTGETTRVSVSSTGAGGNGTSQHPSLSADGRYVAFDSTASNLLPSDTTGTDVFVHDRQTGETTRVSVASDGSQANSLSRFAVLSAHGRYVTFESAATNLVPGDTNLANDVFVHDRQTGETTRVSLASDGSQGNGQSTRAVLSADGRYVAFPSIASNLVADDTNAAQDVFVHDRQTGETTRVSLASNGTEAVTSRAKPLISADGRYVAFVSFGSTASGDTATGLDVFVVGGVSVSPAAVTVAPGGGTAGIDVAFGYPGTPWTATTTAPWISIAAPAGGSSSGSVTFTVSPNPGAPRIGTIVAALQTVTVEQGDASVPLAHDGAVAAAEDTPVTGSLSASDPNGDALTFALVDLPSRGSVALIDSVTGTFNYTPNPNVYGTDTFTFRVTDSGGLVSNTATVTITVASVNDAPVAAFTAGAAIAGRPVIFDPAGSFDPDGTPPSQYRWLVVGESAPTTFTASTPFLHTFPRAGQYPVRLVVIDADGALTGSFEHVVEVSAIPASHIWSWGYNGVGELGAGFTSFSSSPRPSLGLSRVKALASGNSHTVAIADDGQAWAWGYNNVGQLGTATTSNSDRPLALGIGSALSVAGGGWHTLLVNNAGQVFGWGYNVVGQVGPGPASILVPVEIGPFADPVVAVAAGGYHSVALDAAGRVWTWGRNDQGQLGTDTVWSRPTPGAVPLPLRAVAVSAGKGEGLFTAALLEDGSVWAWGDNRQRQVLHSAASRYASPQRVLDGAVALAAGDRHVLAILADGSVMAWGDNSDGQLGVVPAGGVGAPALVPGVGGAVAIEAGARHSLALLADGSLMGWGANAVGQVTGVLGGIVPSTTVGLPGTARGITLAGYHSMALLEPAIVSFAESAIDFGQHAVGAPPATRTVLVTNDGPGPTYLGTSAVLSGATGDFGITDCPARIYLAGESCTISIQFHPTQLGLREASLLLEVAPGTPPLALRGTGAPLNQPPLAADSAVTTLEDTVADATLSASDPEAGPLTFAILTNGALGTAAITDATTGAFTYTPLANAHGTDSFTFQVVDVGGLPSNVATVTITIAPVADVPNVRFREAPFVGAGDMSQPRRSHASALLDDGRVLLAGSDDFRRSAEIFDPQTTATTATGDLVDGRCYGCTAVTLADGRVIVLGGWAGYGVLSSVEAYDAAAGVFATLPAQMTAPRLAATATRLADGRVLIHGGHDGYNIHASAEIFEPATNTFTATGGTRVPRLAPATRLGDGQVLLPGGFSAGGVHLSSAEVYDPQTGTFADVGPLNEGRSSHTVTLLNDGRVLIAGGTGSAASALATAEIYDPAQRTFTFVGSMSSARTGHAAFVRDDGTVIVFGGHDAQGAALASAELFDPSTGQFTFTIPMSVARGWPSVTELRDGRLLVSGGQGSAGEPLSSVEVYGLPAISYGTPLGAEHLTATADVPGAFAFEPPAGTTLAAGVHALSATFTPTDGAEYTVVTRSSAIRVLRARPTLSWTPPADLVEGTPLGAAALSASASVPGSFTYSPSAGTILPLGSHILSVTFTPDDGANYESATATTVLHVVPGLSVTLEYPNGGERVYTTVPTSIRWTSVSAATIDVELSRNSGGTYAPIPGCVGLPASSTSCPWTAEAPSSSTARVRVIARNAAGEAMSDASEANFTISTGTPSITVTTPNTALSWVVGSSQTLRWNHTLGASSFVRIELSRDDGVTWEVLSASVANTAASSGTFPWVVTGPVSATARIRVTALEGPASDISNAAFAIVRPTITVTAPNTAVSWTVTTARSITWRHDMPPGAAVAIDVSRDGGQTWAAVAEGVANATATQGSYTWTVTGPSTTQGRIRVRAVSDAEANDASNVDFAIVDPAITVTAPNTAVNWRSGVTRTIRFAHNLGAGHDVALDLSRDGGVSWSPLTVVTTTATTSVGYDWLVNGPATAQARVRGTLVSDPSVRDESDVDFTILPRITVTAPNTAVTWAAGTIRQITWTHNLEPGELVNIDLSPDGGVSWLPVAAGVANATATTGSHAVRLPDIITSRALVRVSQASNPIEFDVSNVEFTLATPALTVTAPNTNVNWAIGSARSITWTHNLGTQESVGIEVSRDDGATWEAIAAAAPNTAAASGTFSLVVTGPATSVARVRVTWTANAAVQDVSNVTFRIQ